MKAFISLLWVAVAGTVFMAGSSTFGQGVVVVPLGGAVGDATPSDVVKGKTFSCAAGKGLTGTLELNAECTGNAEASDVLAGTRPSPIPRQPASSAPWRSTLNPLVMLNRPMSLLVKPFPIPLQQA